MRPSKSIAGCARRPKWGAAALLSTLLSLLCSNTGCTSLSSGLWKGGRKDVVAERAVEGPAGIAGPTERKLKAAKWEREKRNDPEMKEALAKYDAANALYEAKRYEESEKAFKKLAKERRNTYESFGMRFDRWWGVKGSKELDPYTSYGDPVEEDSLFMVAESQYAQQRFSRAQDSYGDLLERYPSTRYMEESTRKLFRIAMYWLNFDSKVEKDGDVKLASAERIDPASPPKVSRTPSIPFLPNLTDKSRPAFDTDGRALQALRSIWLHDAAGPLADDALMLSANYNLKKGDFIEATRLYKLLREQYPDSDHFQDAHLLGAYVTKASYEGATYDGTPLTEARQLESAALAMFPNMDEEERARLKRDIDRLNNEEVNRLWDKVEFYRAKKQPQSMEIYCRYLINKYPDSPQAQNARTMLGHLAKHKKRLSPPAGVKLKKTPDEPATLDVESEEEPSETPAELSGRIDIDEAP
jgi:TolA-binding protein